jgi:hypothetical protein
MARKVTRDNYQDLDDNVRAVVDKVCLKVSRRNKRFTIDPITIMIIANCIISVIRLLYVCYSNNSGAALKGMREPDWFQKLMIKTQISRYVTSDLSKDVYDAMQEQSNEMEDADVVNIINLYNTGKLFKKGA